MCSPSGCKTCDEVPKGTIDCGLSYDGDHDFTLSGYTDADWTGIVSNMKRTLGCCFSLGSVMISW
jgi:hypothetical protein